MPMKIAVDAMGGDFAPTEIVRGVLIAVRERADIEIILVGDESAVTAALLEEGAIPASVSVRHAPQTIGMHEHPTQAMRRKRDSSLVIAGLMVRDGEVDATFSAGSTGAAMAIATLDIGRIPGIDRPAIATTIPSIKGRTLLIDAGANVDCSPRNLLQFALLGAIYAERVMGVTAPKVGLLNIGAEDTKGNDLTKATHVLLRDAPLNFYGNVEGKDVFEHAVDVVVCDGFAGNVLIKSGEGMAEMVFDLLQQDMDADLHSAELRNSYAPVLRRIIQRVHYSEYGAAPLLGVNGVSFIAHGRSNAKAVASGLRAVATAAASDYVQVIRELLPSIEDKA